MTTIPKGQSVSVLKVEGTWSQVKYGSQTGFVANTYLSNTASTPCAFNFQDGDALSFRDCCQNACAR
ncbi:SH3 domain-containing protein [Acinetobacter soli]